jgi:hypothetical protein
MATFAVIENGIVETTIAAETLEIAQEISGKTCVEYFAVSPGWTYADGKFAPPYVAPVLEEETPAE